jgi:hypothetical protein
MANPSRLSDVLAAVSRSAPESQYIRAYHGSPYDFDRFDASKIGTGEGSQAYGHGLYFAGNEKVSRDYRERLKGLVDPQGGEELGNELQAVIQEIRRLATVRAQTSDAAEFAKINSLLDEAHARHQDVQHRIRSLPPNPGRMYEVEIEHPESALLDLDKDLRGQMPDVQDRLDQMRKSLPLRQRNALASGRPLLESWKNFELEAGPQQAVRTAVQHGIPGTRYLDGISRRDGFGTSNYVMFPGTEDSIRILRKYGLLAPIAAGAAMGEE